MPVRASLCEYALNALKVLSTTIFLRSYLRKFREGDNAVTIPSSWSMVPF